MKVLKDILYKAGIVDIIGSTDIAVQSIHSDSREVGEESLFIAVKGIQVDAYKYIGQTILEGAIAIVCEKMPSEIIKGITYIQVENSQVALPIIASNFYNCPSEKLNLIGITGTNGKTTTVTLLQSVFIELGYKVGLLSTVVNMIGDEKIASTHTTPDPIQLNQLLFRMVDEGCTHCFMEVSSHAIVQERIAGLKFKGAVFTNISHDHLDYHGTFKEYINAKKKFFDELSKDAFSLINMDDRNGDIMVQNTASTVHSFALKTMAEFKSKVIENDISGLHLMLDDNEVWTRLIGEFNAYNLLVVYGVGMLLKEDKLALLTAISNLTAVEGRFQRVESIESIKAIVDYAHTPDALKNVLDALHDVRAGTGKIITVIGCGGNRDVAKRPLMAKVACEMSDKVILTSDNPRNESADAIIKEMEKGVNAVNQRKTLSIVNRKEAIKTACSLADHGDIILVAGKGHEKYQEINGEKLPFNDVQILEDTLKMMED
ncbi:MAG: UDP-N-acetylmuramoyl-L-alanyl-D-glutamate--2,6-diaminopimelate ligase [Flavobacteriales bacterium]|nr:UDP-N-acetylmuramoyl-L-alanyl-D-glutamate--2,6-diaminopimelate ligase [Flavobacteriales bacterium]